MRILYITKGDHVDYQNDCALIGLRECLGVDLVDYPKQNHNYKSFKEEDALKMYGKGMSVTRILDECDVNREDIKDKIKNHYFDYVVYGSVWRCLSLVDEVAAHYKPEEVCVIDGEDETNIHDIAKKGVVYFKRELIVNEKTIHPISFAIPTDKLHFDNIKTRLFSICDPRDRSTYIYKTEADYYNGYRESLFGVTTKKAGWDCMRHYEILGNGCLPAFFDISQCPPKTMANFPKERTARMLDLLQKSQSDVNAMKSLYIDNCGFFQDYTYNHLTTRKLGEYILNRLVDAR